MFVGKRVSGGQCWCFKPFRLMCFPCWWLGGDQLRFHFRAERTLPQATHSECFWTTWPPLTPHQPKKRCYFIQRLVRACSSGTQTEADVRHPRWNPSSAPVSASKRTRIGSGSRGRRSREERCFEKKGCGQVVLAFVAGCCDRVCVSFCIGVCVSHFFLFLVCIAKQ